MTGKETRQLGFHLDIDSCTGCKACQIACKGKNLLPRGLLWRKVVEARGGDWVKRENAWTNNIFAYYISLSCMHCEEAICVEVCPTKASTKNRDGIVYIDPDRCIGCSYCEMACPYGAPRFDEAKNVMTKCDFCRDRVEDGGRPACVDACQMRVLGFGELNEIKEANGPNNEVFPLPNASYTKPSVVLKRVKAKGKSDDDVCIGNEEEL